MSGKCRFLSARNERQMRDRRNGDARQSREKAETEHRKNTDGRRICSPIISCGIGRIGHLKKSGTGKIGHLKRLGVK